MKKTLLVILMSSPLIAGDFDAIRYLEYFENQDRQEELLKIQREQLRVQREIKRNQEEIWFWNNFVQPCAPCYER